MTTLLAPTNEITTDANDTATTAANRVNRAYIGHTSANAPA